MPVIRPLRGLLYGPGLLEDLDRLVAPPYDVIPPETRAALAARHPRNIVHLDLPDGGGDDPYRAAAGRLREWIGAGILARDATPAFYACEQRYRAPGGGDAVRRGFFARLRLHPFEDGVVIPHEKTLVQPRADRERLLAATRTHLSAVFLLHPDPGGGVASLLEQAFAPGAELEARDDLGTLSRVVRITDRERQEELSKRLGTAWALIADGHHRYESALAYREARRAEGRGDADEALAYLCSLDDPGLAIYPIHRIVRSLPRFEAAGFRDRLGEFFDLAPIGDAAALRRALGEHREAPGVFGLRLRGGPGYLLARWKEGAGLERPEMSGVPAPLRRLDVVLLHRLVLEGILGISQEAQARQENLDYVKDGVEWAARAGAPDVDLAVLMNPTRMEQVIDVTRRGGYRLPQKSTYFYPKILTGLVLDPLD